VGVQASIDLSKKMRKSQIVSTISVSRELEERALALFEKYDDKTFSFTDCMSFVVMQDMGIQEAFAFDQHFEQMSFARRP
jgi:predicted nucleic acid-binding protein